MYALIFLSAIAKRNNVFEKFLRIVPIIKMVDYTQRVNISPQTKTPERLWVWDHRLNEQPDVGWGQVDRGGIFALRPGGASNTPYGVAYVHSKSFIYIIYWALRAFLTLWNRTSFVTLSLSLPILFEVEMVPWNFNAITNGVFLTVNTQTYVLIGLNWTRLSTSFNFGKITYTIIIWV